MMRMLRIFRFAIHQSCTKYTSFVLLDLKPQTCDNRVINHVPEV